MELGPIVIVWHMRLSRWGQGLLQIVVSETSAAGLFVSSRIFQLVISSQKEPTGPLHLLVIFCAPLKVESVREP